jgi:hypothetical protein
MAANKPALLIIGATRRQTTQDNWRKENTEVSKSDTLTTHILDTYHIDQARRLLVLRGIRVSIAIPGNSVPSQHINPQE